MRYPETHKDRVREEIVRAASRRFRGGGSEGVAIADLMGDVNLTHGGFYRHFDAKEELFGEALAEAFSQARTTLHAAVERADPGHELEAIIATYLSSKHCANVEEGCPVAALMTETARHSESSRDTFGTGIREHVAAFARYLPGDTRKERERNALVLFSGMAGALNLARATSDPALRDAILEASREFYLRSFRP